MSYGRKIPILLDLFHGRFHGDGHDQPKGPKTEHLDAYPIARISTVISQGRYYARAYVDGKEVWDPLGTTHLQSVAEVKTPANSSSITAAVRRKGKRIGSAKMTFGDAAGDPTSPISDSERSA